MIFRSPELISRDPVQVDLTQNNRHLFYISSGLNAKSLNDYNPKHQKPTEYFYLTQRALICDKYCQNVFQSEIDSPATTHLKTEVFGCLSVLIQNCLDSKIHTESPTFETLD